MSLEDGEGKGKAGTEWEVVMDEGEVKGSVAEKRVGPGQRRIEISFISFFMLRTFWMFEF